MKFGTKVMLVVALTGAVSTGTAIFISAARVHKDGELSLVDKSRAILSRLESVRSYVASQGGLDEIIQKTVQQYPDGKISETSKMDILKRVPIFASMKVGSENAKEEHYEFRVFSDEPRRKENLATSTELEILKRFEADPGLKEIQDIQSDKVILYRPVRLSQAQGCLTCHGDPATSPWGNGKDILGFQMENWADGKLHGAFAIISSTAQVEAAATAATWTIAFWGLFASAVAVGIAFFIMRPALASLKAIVESLNGAGEQVNEAAREISTSSQSLSQSSAQAAAHIEQTSASTEEMNSMIVRNTEFTEKARLLATTAVEKANAGQTVVSSLIMSMEDITQSSKKISDIINVIDDIAFQTNLLALNASVEAARAGDHGKGFAVVAEAVRTLAQRSASSAKEISTLIKDSVEKIENGSSKVHESGSSLDQIVGAVKELAELNSEIAQSSSEQAQGVKQISHAIHDLDSLTQSNAAAAEETAAASEELSSQSTLMRTVVGKLVQILEGAAQAEGEVSEESSKELAAQALARLRKAQQKAQAAEDLRRAA